MRGAWSLARLTIKGHPHGFVATFVAVLAGAALITAAGVLFESGLRGGGVEPERYAGADVVVGADQNLPVPEDLDLTFGERVTLPAGRVDEVASVAGVERTVGDVGFPVSVVTADEEVVGGPGGHPTLGHGWASAGAEASLVSAAGALAGVVPGLFLAFGLRDALAAAGALPADFRLALGPTPALAAIVLCVGVARLAAFVASRRSAGISPVGALGEAAVEPRGLGRVRIALGVLLVPLALFAALVMPLVLPGEYALAGAASSALLLVVSVALLGPRLLTGVVGACAGVLRRSFGAPGFLAVANARANSRRLNSATVALIMGVTFAAVQIFTATTTLAAAEEQARTGLVADHVVTGTASGVSPAVAADLRAVPGVGSVTQVARTQVFATFPDVDSVMITQPYASQGINAAGSAANLDLDVRSGDLAKLRGDDTVALSRMAAGTMRAGLGDTVDLCLGDGAAVRPRVVAIYGSGLGFGDVTLPHDLVVEHTTNRLDAAVLVGGAAGTDPVALGDAVEEALRPYPAAAVADRASFAAAQEGELAGQALVNVVLNAVLLGYIAIAVVNTLVLATVARSREFALLRLVGTHPRQVRLMMRAETTIVVLTAVAVGLLAALPPLVGVSLGLAESPIPSISPTALAGIVGAAALLGWFSIMIPTRVAMRARPVEAIGLRE